MVSIELSRTRVIEVQQIKISEPAKNQLSRGWNSKAALKILRKNHAELCTHFRPGSIAESLCEKLFSSDILSLPLYQDVLDSPRNINKALLDAANLISGNFSVGIDKFTEFLRILEKECPPMAKSLLDQYEGKYTIYNCFQHTA